MLRVDFGALTRRLSRTGGADLAVAPFTAMVLVWGRWFCWLVALFGLASSPADWQRATVGFLPLYILFVTLNGLIHFRLLTNRTVTWHLMLALSIADLVVITGAIVIAGGFSSYTFLAYYTALGAFAVVFTNFWLGLAWTTMTAITYTFVSLTVGSGLEITADLKEMVSRLTVMYAIVLCIGLITRYERVRRQSAVESERQMQRERIAVSQAIHDTTAQTAYMIGLGIHRARELADESNEDQIAVLEGTAALSRSAMWELRRPIDSGHIFEGRELGRVLRSHCSSFERITGVRTELVQSGTEPGLPMETRTGLFTIAHNALTNALLHSSPRRVVARLDFESGSIRLSISDDGVGLPADYAERGQGFTGMRAEAERMGGVLNVASGEGQDGTTITCVVRHEANR